MKTNASLLTLRIPNELKHNIKLLAERQGISINQLALYALTKEVKEIQTSNYLEGYWRNKSERQIIKDYDSVLKKVKNKKSKSKIPEWDKI